MRLHINSFCTRKIAAVTTCQSAQLPTSSTPPSSVPSGHDRSSSWTHPQPNTFHQPMGRAHEGDSSQGLVMIVDHESRDLQEDFDTHDQPELTIRIMFFHSSTRAPIPMAHILIKLWPYPNINVVPFRIANEGSCSNCRRTGHSVRRCPGPSLNIHVLICSDLSDFSDDNATFLRQQSYISFDSVAAAMTPIPAPLRSVNLIPFCLAHSSFSYNHSRPRSPTKPNRCREFSPPSTFLNDGRHDCTLASM